MARKRSRSYFAITAALLVVAALAYAFWPRPISVDMGEAKIGAMQVTVNEEGFTRVHDAYVVSSPVAGRLLRVEVEPGDPVIKGETVIAQMRPRQPCHAGYQNPRAGPRLGERSRRHPTGRKG